MQPNRTFLGFKLTSLLSLLVLLSLSACAGCGNGPNKKKDLAKTPKAIINPKAIILFHGINDKGNLKNLADKLAKDFPDAKVVALDRDNSASESIIQQAKGAFEELKKQDLLDRDLVLFGNSQGGLLAFSLYDQYQKQLNVKGIITDCTPWEGAPVASATKRSISQLTLAIAQAIKNQENVLSDVLKPFVNFMDANQISNFIDPILQDILQGFTNGTGGQDLKPGSQFLTDVATKLPTSQIPILALAGTDVDLNAAIPGLISQQEGNTGGGNVILESLLSSIQSKKINLDSVKDPWGKLMTNNKEPYNAHDLIIPLYSAHAKNIHNKPASFQASPAVPGYHHFMSLVQLPQLYGTVVETIKQYFAQNDANSGQ
jgi:pimeloyl-ACP methyl ester carboxylesterase